MLAMVYLVIIIVFVTLLINFASRHMRRVTEDGTWTRWRQSRQAARIDGLFLARTLGRMLVYAALLFWAFVCLFPIYWTVTTSFKSAVNVTQGHLVPWLDCPDWRGWRAPGLSPDTIGQMSTAREEFVKRFTNSVVASLGASTLAIVLGSPAAYGLSRFYRFGPDAQQGHFFFFVSQLILPPVVLALPLLPTASWPCLTRGWA